MQIYRAVMLGLDYVLDVTFPDGPEVVDIPEWVLNVEGDEGDICLSRSLTLSTQSLILRQS